MFDVASSDGFLTDLKHVSSMGILYHRGVSSDMLGDVLALAGDASDNIPGVRMSLNLVLVSEEFQS